MIKSSEEVRNDAQHRPQAIRSTSQQPAATQYKTQGMIQMATPKKIKPECSSQNHYRSFGHSGDGPFTSSKSKFWIGPRGRKAVHLKLVLHARNDEWSHLMNSNRLCYGFCFQRPTWHFPAKMRATRVIPCMTTTMTHLPQRYKWSGLAPNSIFSVSFL